MGREFELKYAATPEILRAIQAEYGTMEIIAMETAYYDSRDQHFSSRKMTLRLRKENGVTVCTLKTPLAEGGRGEWECPASNIRQGLSQLLRQGAPIAASPEDMELQEVCGARFTRLAIQLPAGDGTVELALDQGVLLGGDRKTDLCEVEVEQKTCSDAAAIAFAAALAKKYGLQPEPRSKFRRALALMKGA